jgi:hypothetical protein
VDPHPRLPWRLQAGKQCREPACTTAAVTQPARAGAKWFGQSSTRGAGRAPISISCG